MFRDEFIKVVSGFTSDSSLGDALWNEIERHYSEPGRYYHNLKHLDALLIELLELRSSIRDWPGVVLAIGYHDIIYDVLKQDNEERSAACALEQLEDIAPSEVLQHCKGLILATKLHERSADSDCNYFTDADMSILGAEPARYREYALQVRKEYGVYPDAIYRPGRRKVLQQFLEMERIYKTTEVFDRYEIKARNNIEAELRIKN